MRKITDSWKIELVLLVRNFWTWIFLLLALVSVGLQFNSRLQLFDPGGALISTAFIIQGGIFVSMILGLSLVQRESVTSSNEMFYVLPNGYSSKIVGKCLALLTAIIVFIILSVMILYFLFWKFGVPYLFYWKSFIYLSLYWGTSFWISGIIGMIIGSYVKSRIAYPLLVFIWIFIGPLNSPVIKNFMAIFNTDLTPIGNFINLGQTDPYTPYDPVYGLPMEIHRWLQKGIWVISVTFIFLTITVLKSYRKPVFTVLILSGLLILNLPLVLLFNKEEQVIRTGYEANAVRNYDRNYYTQNTKPSFENSDSFIIESYEIDLKSFRNVTAQVKIKGKPIRTTEKLIFTLYHQLRIKSVTDENNVELSFKQVGDQILVSFPVPLKSNEHTTIVFNYEGISSPYFYANDQAVMLPAYFPWLPISGSYQAMKAEGSELIRYPLYPRNPTKYILRYSGPEPLFTNLQKKNTSVWTGQVPNGISLVAGMMTETRVGQTKVCYPVSLYKMIDTTPLYLKKVQNIAKNVNTDLNIQKSFDVSRIFFLSVPDESNLIPSNIWNLEDHLIIGINQMYNEGDLLNYDITIVPAILSSLVKNHNMINQREEIKSLFIASYAYWYGLKHNSSIENERPILVRMLDYYQNTKLNKEASVTKEILKLIDNNKTNQLFLQAFFRDWLGRLDQNHQLNWNDILELEEAAKSGDTKVTEHF
ncbi:MAG: hypothetical protein CVV03_02680 [Firmicutes bacterium HGW-Firmicutes-8]|nr:MAG: hypothetical protein CVV03_02680 [Firmicutes bacterium HGW-Firmicutes-8]